MTSDRTTLRLDDERKRRLDRAAEIVADGPADDPPRSVVIDAALQHLIESRENIQEARGEVDPATIQEVANTSVLGLRYRTRVKSRWR
jgi:predicted transcriptional regulator